MKLPEKFKFLCKGQDVVFTANAVGTQVYVSWDDGQGDKCSVSYPVSDVAWYVQRNTWTILPESFPQLIKLSEGLQALISEKNDASELAYDELESLLLTRALITRLLDGRN